MARKKATYDHAMGKIVMGIGFLIVAGMLYLGYGWMEIFAVLGILAIIKGLYYMKK